MEKQRNEEFIGLLVIFAIVLLVIVEISDKI